MVRRIKIIKEYVKRFDIAKSEIGGNILENTRDGGKMPAVNKSDTTQRTQMIVKSTICVLFMVL